MKLRGRIRSALSLLFPIGALALGKVTGAIPPPNYPLLYHKAESPVPEPGFVLEEQSGILPGIHPLPMETFPASSRRSPGFVAACDLTHSGFDDVVSLYNRPDHFGLLEIFRNVNGRRFEPMTDNIGLAKEARSGSFTVVACADLDNDGWEDLVLGGIGQNLLVFRNVQGKRFVLWAEIPAFDETRAINIFDANGDGFLDIFAGNYRELRHGSEEDKFRVTNYALSPPTLYRNDGGGGDKLYLNQAGTGKFIQAPAENLPEHGLTLAVGVGDFNADGHPDLFLAKDLGQDQVLFGDGKGKFQNVTEWSIGKVRSRNSMSAVVADFSGSGLPDVFVSNRPKAGMTKGYNSLWINDPANPGKFTDRAYELGVDACGMSWGAQLGDLNQDGYPDLLVVNGFFYGNPAGKNGWYVSSYIAGIPSFFREYPMVIAPYRQGQPEDMPPSPEKCVFLGSPGGKFSDQGRWSGINDGRISRGVVLFDYDHDGAVDVLTGNPYEGPVLFKNRLSHHGTWLSVKLHGTRSNASGIGSRIALATDGGRVLTHSYYPLNGLQSQAGSDIVFTLREKESPNHLTVIWPSGRQSILRSPPVNSRIDLVEP